MLQNWRMRSLASCSQRVYTIFSKTSLHSLQRVSHDCDKCPWTTVDSSPFSNVLQFLRATKVIGTNSFFAKSPQKVVWSGKVRRSRWPKGTPNNALAKDLCFTAVVDRRTVSPVSAVRRRTRVLSPTLTVSRNCFTSGRGVLFDTLSGSGSVYELDTVDWAYENVLGPKNLRWEKITAKS
jgi:hypothetical protein